MACIVSIGSPAMRLSPKTPRLSRCLSTSLEANKEKNLQKNSRIFFGHFEDKSLENLQKTAQKTMRNRPKKTRILTQKTQLKNRVAACCSSPFLA
jgi:hypothetical protein